MGKTYVDVVFVFVSSGNLFKFNVIYFAFNIHQELGTTIIAWNKTCEGSILPISPYSVWLLTVASPYPVFFLFSFLFFNSLLSQPLSTSFSVSSLLAVPC